RLVPTPVIASHIKKVYKEAGVSFEDAAVEVIAEAGAGSVRDALSVADMCLSYCDNKVTYEKVLEVLGASDPKKIGELAKATLYGDVGKALNMAKTIADLGKSVAMLSKDLAEFVRNIMFIKNCPNAESVLSLPVELFKTMKELGDTFLNQRLLFVLNVFSSLEGELRYSSQQRVLFDAAIVKACVGEASDAKGEAAYGQGADLAAVEERIKRLEAKVSQQNDYFKLEERIRALESKKPAIDLTLLDRIARLEEALKDLKEVGNTDAAEDSAKEQSETNIDYKEKDGVVPVFDEMPFFIDEQEDKKKDEEAPLFVLDTLDEPLPFDALEEKEEKPKGVYGARKLFDYVMTKLRRETYDDGECKNKFLVLALSAGEPEIKGEDLVIYLPSEATVNLLSQKKNRDKINGILKEISDYKVDFKARLKLSEENTTQYILKMFGDDVKIKP
ncbi:MAG: hypothetical protein GX891_01025, partial [Clostridiales bacterium]|nr:hypothetical protein [Clostridiales bacterium]